MVLGILPDNATFTITLPSGQVVTGNHNLGSVNHSLSGIYTFTTAQGCVESLELIITPASEEDTDNDGVTNLIDQCPNTPQGATVNTLGCEETSNFPLGQFTTTITANSCATETNGQVNIISTVTSNFLATLSSESETVASYDFSNSLTIPELATGTYDLCITDTSLPNLEACFSLVIEATDVLSIRSNLNETSTSITLYLSGAETFLITLNNQALKTDLSEITLELEKDINELTVRSNNNC